MLDWALVSNLQTIVDKISVDFDDILAEDSQTSFEFENIFGTFVIRDVFVKDDLRRAGDLPRFQVGRSRFEDLQQVTHFFVIWGYLEFRVDQMISPYKAVA